MRCMPDIGRVAESNQEGGGRESEDQGQAFTSFRGAIHAAASVTGSAPTAIMIK